jgi:hypothetical protein
MFSIRSAAILLMATLAGGCTLEREQAKGVDMQLSSQPLVEDQAMRHRNWPLESWKYENTSTYAQPTELTFRPKPLPALVNSVVDPTLFFVNILASPVAYATQPPWTPVYYRAVNIEPTYTAVPAQPGEKQ